MRYFSELDMYLFGHAVHYEVYKKLGAHAFSDGDTKGVIFDVWAPHAADVYLIGEFNNWNEKKHKMARLEPSEIGVYELFVPEAKEGQLYRFLIHTHDGRKLYKSDPFASAAQLRPETASKIFFTDHFKWTDKKWMEEREGGDPYYEKPLAIYEVHPGSWKRHPGRKDEGFYTYKEFAHSLAEYVLDMGYTHVELMGISEHPFDGSWGYQVTGYYAPTSRYGSPSDFMYFVNYMHDKGIGVILDWVPAHFPRDEFGLAEFDGKPLYEYADPRKGQHPHWGTNIFDTGKSEVKNFLIGSALNWAATYHIDGLRVDAVASMLYLDYGKQDGEWVANKYGGNENLEAIEFFKHINTVLTGSHKGFLMIAEESTAWPRVTQSVKDEGLNFSYKWNMGWMHDFLDYMKLDPYFRKDNHNKMTFAMSYNEYEKYILVLSHDEVVHLKCSMINKMPGLMGDKFKNLKVAYAFMMGHPGKKLLFMGQDFAQLREWSEDRELDWALLAEEDHQNINDWVKDLLHIYKEYPACYELDSSWEGFKWINANDSYRSIFSFVRKSKKGTKNLLFVFNFTPVAYEDYRVGTISDKRHTLILNSEDSKYGGVEKKYKKTYTPEKKECDGMEYSIEYPLPAYGVAIFAC